MYCVAVDVFFTGGLLADYRKALFSVLRKGQRSRRYFTELCSLSAWRLVYNLVQDGADVNAPDSNRLTPLTAALASPTEPLLCYREYEAPWGGMWPEPIMKYRLDNHMRDVVLRDPQYVIPCMGSERVSDKDCVVELMLRAGANPNVLIRNTKDDRLCIWLNLFINNSYPHPIVLALILANVEVCCCVPNEDCHTATSDISLFEHVILVCTKHLTKYEIGHCRWGCNSYGQTFRSLVRCVYLLVAAGAYVSADHVDSLMTFRNTAKELLSQDELLVTIRILENLCEAASSPRTLADLSRLRLRAALRTFVDPDAVPRQGGWRLGLANRRRNGYSPYISPRTTTKTFQQRLSRLELSSVYRDLVTFNELKTFWERFSC